MISCDEVCKTFAQVVYLSDLQTVAGETFSFKCYGKLILAVSKMQMGQTKKFFAGLNANRSYSSPGFDDSVFVGQTMILDHIF